MPTDDVDEQQQQGPAVPTSSDEVTGLPNAAEDALDHQVTPRSSHQVSYSKPVNPNRPNPHFLLRAEVQVPSALALMFAGLPVVSDHVLYGVTIIAAGAVWLLTFAVIRLVQESGWLRRNWSKLPPAARYAFQLQAAFTIMAPGFPIGLAYFLYLFDHHDPNAVGNGLVSAIGATVCMASLVVLLAKIGARLVTPRLIYLSVSVAFMASINITLLVTLGVSNSQVGPVEASAVVGVYILSGLTSLACTVAAFLIDDDDDDERRQ